MTPHLLHGYIAVRARSHRVVLFTETLLLATVFFAAILLRVGMSWNHPAYVPGDATCFYPAEAALQYRWAWQLASEGTLPPVDLRAQWPEGLRFGIDITPVMEHVAAAVWRFLPLRPATFFDYSILFIAVVSSFPVLLAYAAVRALGGGALGGLVAAFLTGFHPWSLERVVRNFGRENFTLTFVLLPLVCLLWLWRQDRAPMAPRRIFGALAIAFAAQAVAFASWHMARPLFEFHAGMLLLLALSGAVGARPMRLASVWFLTTAPLWVLLPVLSVRTYALTPNIVALTLVALGLGFARSRRGRVGAVVLAVCLYAFAVAFIPRTDDSHIAEVVRAKVAHLWIKPQDPAQLSPEARLMWIEAFNSPSRVELLVGGVPLVLVGAALGLVARRRLCARLRRHKAAWLGLGVLCIGWTLAYCTFQRLVIFFLFGMAVVLGLLASEALRSRRRASAAVLVILLCGMVGLQTAAPSGWQLARQQLQTWLEPQPSQLFQNRFADTRDLIVWLRTHTQPDDVVAAWFGLSSLIYAYADRPVIVQSKFENPTVRPKTLALAKALYGTPQELSEYCRRYGAKYFVYEAPMVLHHGTESYRYIAGARTLPTSCTVAMMHFRPHDLDDFRLVYQNRGFRVFRFVGARTTTESVAASYGWFPLYDREWCGIGNRDGDISDAMLDKAVERALMLERQLALAQVLDANGKTQDALRMARSLLSQEPRLWQAALLMAKIYAASGNAAAAEKACSMVEIGFPKCPELPVRPRVEERNESQWN